MADKKHGTSIEWTHGEGFKGETWNPVTGCSKVSPGCAHCYAETLSLRFGWSPKPWTPENAAVNVRLRPERLDQPLRWRKPRMIFVNSMSDLFHELIPDAYIADVFDVMARAEQHTFQVLTKRPERALEWFGNGWTSLGKDVKPLPNVWLGVSIENARYTYRADVLRDVPAAVRFISAEPLLSSLISPRSPRRLNLSEPNTDTGTRLGQPLNLDGIRWVIAGGESGPNARPMLIEWARELRDACTAEGVAFFFKQWGGRTAKSGGKVLDGREWCEMPVAA